MTERVRFSEFWFLFSQTFRQAGRLSIWMPLLIYGFLTYLLALMHYHLFSPVTGPVVAAWINLIKPSLATPFYHYPAHFVLFSVIFSTARVILSVVLEAFLFGVVLDMFVALYNGSKPAFLKSFGYALKRYFALTAIWAVLIALQVLISLYFNSFIEDVIGFSLQASPRRQMAADLARGLVAMVVYTPFVFVLPSIIAGEASWGRSISRAVALVFRHPFVSFGLVFIPFFLIGFVPNYVAAQTDKIVSNFYPELVFYLAVATVALDVLLNFIFLGTTIKFFMDHYDE